MSALEFELPTRLEAREPPEASGLSRDAVRLMATGAGAGRIVHARFRDLPTFLAPGDLLVVNVSATIPAALATRRSDGTALELHLSSPAPASADDRLWVVELRRDGLPFGGAQVGETLLLAGGGRAEVVAPFATGVRLWLVRLLLPAALEDYLARHGHPIRYGYVPGEWPLASYQNVYAHEPGSVEMASAGRPLTGELIGRLVGVGVQVAPITLHTGVSSPERHESPYPERYSVPEQTARLANAVRAWGGRVVAVGTTVVRALESVAQPDGTLTAGAGWTSLVIGGERGVRALDGLITGWHEPDASHLELLRAFMGDELLGRCYAAALERGYLWHEFGDSMLVLP